MNSSSPCVPNHRLRPLLRHVASIATLLLVAVHGASGQMNEAMQPMATRSDLTSLSDRLSRGSNSDRAQASILRARLREGDFRPGDRISLAIEGNVTLTDTVPVTAGSKVTLPDIGEIPLAGVLRSELQNHMKTQLAKFVRDARVRATPLIRLSILGPVGKPGFYFMPPDIPLSDAVMRAGGPGANSDLARSVIRRGTDELYDSRNIQTAISEGLTLDQLSLRSGDEIVVGQQSTRNWQSIAQVLSVVTSLALAISYGFSRR